MAPARISHGVAGSRPEGIGSASGPATGGLTQAPSTSDGARPSVSTR